MGEGGMGEGESKRGVWKKDKEEGGREGQTDD